MNKKEKIKKAVDELLPRQTEKLRVELTDSILEALNEPEEECKHKWQGGYFVSGQLKKDLISILRDQGVRFEVKGDCVLIKSQPHEPEDKLERIEEIKLLDKYGYLKDDKWRILEYKSNEHTRAINKLNKV